MSLPSEPLWRECLATALQKNAHHQHCQYIQLATCDTAGVPDCRTLVYRGFAESSDKLIMHTDLRSHKITQLRANNRGEICWYFSGSREQFRLTGSLEIITSKLDTQNEIRQRHWLGLSNEARASYYQPAPGSAIIVEQENGEKQCADDKTHGAPAETFALLLFKPLSVDHLLLAAPAHKRTQYRLNSSGNWYCEKVNP